MARTRHLNLHQPRIAHQVREDARTRPPADPVVRHCKCGGFALYGFEGRGMAIYACARCAPEWLRSASPSSIPKYGESI